MAVSDSHCNGPSEFSDRKRCKEEENPQTIASPEQGGTRKRKRRRKKNEESNEEPQGEVSPKPLLDTVIPQGENAEATTQNPNPSPQKKETKKNVQGEQQLQTGVEPDITKEEGERQGDANGNGGLCPKPLLDTSIPIAPQEGIAETTSQKANPMPRKRKKKNVQGEHQLQTCDPSIPIVVEPDVTKEEGAQQGDAKSKHGTAVLGLNEERPVPDSTPLEDTPGKKRSRKKKNVIKRQGAESEPEQKESNNTENPQQCSLDPGPKNKLEKGADTNAEQSRACPEPELARPLDIAIPIDSEVEKRAEPTEAKVEHPQACSKPELACPIDLLAPVNLEKKKEVEPSEARAQHPQPQPFSKHETAVPGINEERPVPDPTTPEDTPHKKKSRKKKNVLKLQGAEPEPEPTVSSNTEHPQQCSPESELKIKMKKEAEANAEHSRVCSKPELSPPLDIGFPNDSEVEKRTEPTEAKVEHPQSCSDPKLASPIDLPTPMNLEKKKEAESSEAHAQHPQPQPCSKHETVVPEINEEHPVPDPTPLEDTLQKEKLRKKKNVLKPQGAEPEPEPEPKESNNTEHPQQCSPDSELKIKMKQGAEANAEHSRVSSKPELSPPLDIAFPIDSKVEKRAEPTEAKMEHPQACLEPKLASPIDLPTPTNLEKKKEADLREAHAQHPQPQPCSKHETAVLGINEEHPVPDPTPLEDTPQKKLRKKKNVLKPQGAEPEPEPEPEPKESNNTQHPQQCSADAELKIKMKQGAEANAEHFPVRSKPELAAPLDIAFPNDSEVKKGAEPTEAKVEHPQVCSEPKLAPQILLPTPINPEKKKEAEPSEACVQHPQPQPCSTPSAESPGDPATPVNQSRRKRKNKRGKEKIMCSESPLHTDITLNLAANQVQQDPATPICLQSASLTDQTIPVDPAIPVDTEQKMKTNKGKKQKNALEGEEPNNNKHNTEQPEIPIQTSTCLIAAPPVHPAIPMDPCPAIPICPAISTDPEQKMSKKTRKRKRKSVLNSEAAKPNEHSIEAAEPNEHNGKLPETPPEAPVQKSIYPTGAPSIDPPATPINTATPIGTETLLDQGQKMTEKKRTRKRRSRLISEGAEPNEPHSKPPETPVQSSVYPIVALSMDPTIPLPAPPVDTATLLDQGQKMTKKKRMRKRRSMLISEGAEPSEPHSKPPETPVQSSVYPIIALSMDPTIPVSAPPVDTATPVDQEQMTKRKRKKRRKSTAETPVQKTEEPPTENSMGGCNAEPAAKTPVQITNSLGVTKSPFKQNGEGSVRCRACRQLGHKFQHCLRLKCLSKDEEVCFFCGEIGHSLGKCSVSQAGGGRFAKCLFCYERGHFSYNCPRNGHEIYPKVVAANGVMNRTVEAEGEPLAEV